MKPRDAILAVAAVLVVLILGEWIASRSRIARIYAPVPATAAAPGPIVEAAQTAATPGQVDRWLATVLARPLMTPSRAAAAKAGGPALALDGGLPRLAGTVAGADPDAAANTAVFARGQTGKPLILHAGAVVGPYRIVRILPGSVVLDGPDGRQVVRPSFGPPGTTALSEGEAPVPGMPNNAPNFAPPNFPQPNFPGLVPQTAGPGFPPGRTE